MSVGKLFVDGRTLRPCRAPSPPTKLLTARCMNFQVQQFLKYTAGDVGKWNYLSFSDQQSK